MAYFKNMFVSGKFQQLEDVSGLPVVRVVTFRRVGDVLYEDVRQMSCAYPPRVGDAVQGFDGEYHEVVSIHVSYLEASPPIFQVVCKAPSNKSLNC